MRNRQGVTIAALIIAIVGLSIGFAAFSNTLTIRGTATVTPDRSNFSVVFSTNASELETNPVTPNSATLGDAGTINNREGNPRLTGLKAKFTSPGDSVTYSLYVLNNGQYDAYLTNLNFDTVDGSNFVKCISGSGATDTLTQQACGDISVTVQVGQESFSSNAQTGLTNTLNNHVLLKGNSEPVTVTISYANNNHYVDGPVTIMIGDIQLQYRTVNTPTQTVTPSPEPTPESCFVSVIPGQINDYLCNDTELVIADNLQLPTTDVTALTFNSQKCAAFESLLTTVDSNNTCTNLEGKFNYLKQSQQGIQQLYGTFLGALAIATYGDESSTKNSITTMGPGLFAGRSLTSVELGEGITSVSDFAFTSNSISNLKLPSTLTSVGQSGFDYNNLETVDLKNVQTISENAFNHNQLLYVDIPNSVTSIGELAFNRNNIQSVSLGSGLISTGYGSFQHNEITNIDFSRATNLTTIDNYAFSSNDLTSVTIPNSVTTIGSAAFGSNNLTSVILGTGITTLDEYSFANSTSSITMSDGTVRNYGPNRITSVTINALKANVSYTGASYGGLLFDYAPGSGCTNTVQDDWKSNTCITWVNG